MSGTLTLYIKTAESVNLLQVNLPPPQLSAFASPSLGFCPNMAGKLGIGAISVSSSYVRVIVRGHGHRPRHLAVLVLGGLHFEEHLFQSSLSDAPVRERGSVSLDILEELCKYM
jgi:hypothetical protein